MKLTLRKYQLEGVDAATHFFKSSKSRSALIVAPTGSGKSLYVANTCNNVDGKVLVLQPSKEILEQNYAKYTAYDGNAGVFSASVGRKDIDRVTFATMGAVANNLDLFKDVRQVIIDEAHLATGSDSVMDRFIRSLNNPKVLGLTATPFRMYPIMGGSMLKMLTRTRPKMFDSIIHYTQIQELLQDGYLAKLNYYRLCKGFDRSKIRINSSGSDFDEDSLKAYYRTIHFIDEIVDVVSRINDKGRQVLCFTNFVSDAEEVATRMRSMGYPSEVVTGKTKKAEREQIIQRFKTGITKSVINVGTLTTGFDYPELDSVVIARPMRSLSLWCQMVGRAMRPHPNKQDGWVVDLCWNYEVFGPMEDLVLDFEKGNPNLPFIKGRHGKLTGVLLSKDEDAVKKFEAEYGNWFTK